MLRAVLLHCPICNSVRAFEGNRDDYSTAELWARAKTHLRGHALDESKTAIRKYQTAAAEELIVSSADVTHLPTTEWQDPTAAWLPDGVDSANVTAEGHLSHGEPLPSHLNGLD